MKNTQLEYQCKQHVFSIHIGKTCYNVHLADGDLDIVLVDGELYYQFEQKNPKVYQQLERIVEKNKEQISNETSY